MQWGSYKQPQCNTLLHCSVTRYTTSDMLGKYSECAPLPHILWLAIHLGINQLPAGHKNSQLFPDCWKQVHLCGWSVTRLDGDCVRLTTYWTHTDSTRHPWNGHGIGLLGLLKTGAQDSWCDWLIGSSFNVTDAHGQGMGDDRCLFQNETVHVFLYASFH